MHINIFVEKCRVFVFMQANKNKITKPKCLNAFFPVLPWFSGLETSMSLNLHLIGRNSLLTNC